MNDLRALSKFDSVVGKKDRLKIEIDFRIIEQNLHLKPLLDR